MKTGLEIDHRNDDGLLSLMEAEEKQLKDFVNLRLKATAVDKMNPF